MWSETVSLWPWLQDRGIVKPAKLWIYPVVSVRTLLLCGNTRALTSLSLWDTTFCTVPCAGSRRTHPWASQCCVEEKDQLAGGATVADTFDFLPDTRGTGTRRFWQAGAVGWRNTEATGSGRARAGCAGEGRSGPCCAVRNAGLAWKCRRQSKYHYKTWAEGRFPMCSGMWTNWLIRTQVQKWERRTESDDKTENSHVLQVLWNRHQAMEPDSRCSAYPGQSKASCAISTGIVLRSYLEKEASWTSWGFCFSIISTQSATLAFKSFWPSRVKAEERCITPHLLVVFSSQGKITVSAVRKIPDCWSQT